MTMPTHLGYGLERLQDRPKGTRCSEELLLFRYNKKTNSLWLYNQGLTRISEADRFIIQLSLKSRLLAAPILSAARLAKHSKTLIQWQLNGSTPLLS